MMNLGQIFSARVHGLERIRGLICTHRGRQKDPNQTEKSLASDTIAVAIQFVDVAPHDTNRPAHIGWPIPRPSGAVHVRGDRDTRPGIIRVTRLRRLDVSARRLGKACRRQGSESNRR